MSGRGVLSPCPICNGDGLVAFDDGPAVEPCTTCAGTGRTFSDPQYRGLFRALVGQRGVFLDREMRLLLVGLDALERRVEALEEAARPG